jgi:drug/metabolite transporter (DMT)-like permease
MTAPASLTAVTTRRPALDVAMVLASGVLFAVNGTVSKLVLRARHRGAPAAVRAAGAFAALLLLSLVMRPGARRLRITAGELSLLVGYGLTGFFLVPTAADRRVGHIGVSTPPEHPDMPHTEWINKSEVGSAELHYLRAAGAC